MHENFQYNNPNDAARLGENQIRPARNIVPSLMLYTKQSPTRNNQSSKTDSHILASFPMLTIPVDGVRLLCLWFASRWWQASLLTWSTTLPLTCRPCTPHKISHRLLVSILTWFDIASHVQANVTLVNARFFYIGVDTRFAFVVAIRAPVHNNKGQHLTQTMPSHFEVSIRDFSEVFLEHWSPHEMLTIFFKATRTFPCNLAIHYS